MDIATFLELAEAYTNLGGSVQQQLREFVDDSDGDFNMNALRLIKEFTRRLDRAGIEDTGWMLEVLDERLAGIIPGAARAAAELDDEAAEHAMTTHDPNAPHLHQCGLCPTTLFGTTQDLIDADWSAYAYLDDDTEVSPLCPKHITVMGDDGEPALVAGWEFGGEA